MGKKGFALIFAALMMVVGGTVYAGSHMVVVFDVESGKVVAVYDAKTSGAVAGGKITFDANADGKAGGESIENKVFTVNKKGEGKKPSKITGKTNEGYGIPDYTVIRSAASPGCITYTYHGYSWTVCN
jgi:hypothetical protein